MILDFKVKDLKIKGKIDTAFLRVKKVDDGTYGIEYRSPVKYANENGFYKGTAVFKFASDKDFLASLIEKIKRGEITEL